VRAGGTLRVREIPIAFRERVRGKSKMSFGIALRFFFRWVRAMFQHLVRGPYHAERARKPTIGNVSINPKTFRE
jgi:hypothetical protein